jgi:hypothetical protein
MKKMQNSFWCKIKHARQKEIDSKTISEYRPAVIGSGE